LIEPKKSIKNIKNKHKQLVTFQKIQKNILEKIKMGFSKNSTSLILFYYYCEVFKKNLYSQIRYKLQEFFEKPYPQM